MLTHCENDAIIRRKISDFASTGKLTHPQFFEMARPVSAELDAIQHILHLSDMMGLPLYVVHVSTREGAQVISRAAREGQVVFGETCPQYLYLSTDYALKALNGFEKAKLVCQPPLRASRHSVALAKHLVLGNLHAVGTDHCPFNYAGQKDLGCDDFRNIPGGLPGIESRLALLYPAPERPDTDLPLHVNFSLNRWVELCCTNPAKIFGLYPRKGTLMPGADADVVIFDPLREVTITHDFLHENVDYTPYEGFNVTGWPEVTISRGEIIVQEGQYIGAPGRGRYIKRETFSRPLVHKEA